MSHTLERNALACVCFILLIILAPYAYAEDANLDDQEGTPNVTKGPFKPEDGVYVTGSWIGNNTIGGDFDNSTFYTSDTAVYDVPEINDGQGFAVTLGHTSAPVSFEIGYLRTIHDTHTTFTDIGDQEAAFNAIDFNIKLHIIKEGRFRPYVLFGFGIPWITIENSKVENGSYSAETFRGISGNLGAGLAFYITPRIFVNAGAMYRFSSFRRVDGMSLDTNLFSSGPSYFLGLGYTF